MGVWADMDIKRLYFISSLFSPQSADEGQQDGKSGETL